MNFNYNPCRPFSDSCLPLDYIRLMSTLAYSMSNEYDHELPQAEVADPLTGECGQFDKPAGHNSATKRYLYITSSQIFSIVLLCTQLAVIICPVVEPYTTLDYTDVRPNSTLNPH